LDYGADKFIDHTVIGGHSLGVSQTIIALLIAGAEYEEASQLCISELLCKLAIRLARRGGCCHSGNRMGSSISNIPGAFSLGLLFHLTQIHFDRSAKIYAAVLLAVMKCPLRRCLDSGG
ncbi:hypothetical protein V8F44DRAFT_481094, partial [Aspergillus fumigatus]